MPGEGDFCDFICDFICDFRLMLICPLCSCIIVVRQITVRDNRRKGTNAEGNFRGEIVQRTSEE